MTDTVRTREAALQRYDLGEHRLVRLAESFNTVFRIVAPNASFVLRVGPEVRVHPEGAVLDEAACTTRRRRWPRRRTGP